MERRKAIKNIGLSFGAMATTPFALSILQSCKAQDTPWIPTFFTEYQGKFIKKLVDTILPATDHLPSATEVNAHIFIDKFSKDVLSVDHKPSFRSITDEIIDELLVISGEESIDRIGQDSYEELLTTYLPKSKVAYNRLTNDINEYVEEDDKDLRGLDKELRFFHFLYNFRDLCILAYRTNEVVGEGVMKYKAIPGEQRGCVDLEETTAGMAWSLT